MLMKIYKKASPLQLILVMLLPGLWWIPAWRSGVAVGCDEAYSLFCQFLNTFNQFGGGIPATLLSLVFLLASGFLLTFSLASVQLISRQTFFPALFLPLLASYSPALQHFHSGLPALLLLTGAMHYLLRGFDKYELTKELFSGSLLVSLAILFHLPALPFALLPFITLLVYRVFDWRQWVAALAGLITPLLYLSALSWFFYGTLPLHTFANIIISPSLPVVGNLGWPLVLFWSFTAILLLRMLGSILYHSGERVISFRKRQLVLLWFLLLSQAGLFFSGPAHLYHSILIFVPFSFYLTYFFIDRNYRRKWMHNLILYLYLLSLLLMFLLNDTAYAAF
jgi:hypothetical protein